MIAEHVTATNNNKGHRVVVPAVTDHCNDEHVTTTARRRRTLMMMSTK